MKKGFTLIEVLAVITLIAIISLLAIPSVINQVNNKREELSDVTLTMFSSATELYMDKFQDVYPRTLNNVYCITLKSLVDEGFLTEPLKDIKTDEEIEVLTKVGESYEAKTKMKVVVTGTIDLDFTFIDENNGETCSEVRN